MPRPFDVEHFRAAFDRWIVAGRFNERPDYYPRYRSRYEGVLRRFAARAELQPASILDVGGGQLALLCHVLWGDRVMVADVGGEHLEYLRECGVPAARWNLALEEASFGVACDTVFLAEVIEHLPIPGYVALDRLKRVLRPGGMLVCTTPNFYRLRNVVYVAMGRRIFDHFRRPEEGPLGHVIEYDEERLRWQFERAGFPEVDIEMCYFPHTPNEPVFRALSLLGRPLFLVPRFRDCMVVFARAPSS